MRSLILSVLLLASTYETTLGAVEGAWTYSYANGGTKATILTYTGSGGAVIIPSVLGGYTVTSIGDGTWPPPFFSSRNSITSVTIPNSVTTIGENAFSGFTSLTTIAIPDSVISISNWAFSGCSNLNSVTGGNNVTTIGQGVFGSCTALTNITIGRSVTSIGAGAFYDCNSLASITLPNSITSIGNGLFQSCDSLTSITIPNNVTRIPSDTFNQCINLTNVIIPNRVTSIGANAFTYCIKLSSVTIPNSLTNIEDFAFSGSYFTSLIIPNGVTSIGVGAFQYCDLLSQVTIGNSVSSIGLLAFRSCKSLASVSFMGNIPSNVGDLVFMDSAPTVYYFSGTLGWGSSFAGRPTSLVSLFALSVSCDTTKGSVSIDPAKQSYMLGETVTVVATPRLGYLLTNWSGDSVASTGSINIIMNSDKVLAANFSQDNADNDGDGLSNFQESVSYGTSPNQKDTNSDGIEDGQAVALGYSPNFNFSALISHLQSHPPTGLYTATQMQAMAIGDLVLTKNANGSFTLNYDIQQSTDLQTWIPYQALSLPLTGLPTDKAFVRIKAKQ